ncbi:hypothetical protein ACO0OL_000530 [Hanseniaspora opuntiae]
MAKSLRAKSSHKAKRFRRHNLEYQSVVDERAERIANKAIDNYISEKIKLARENGDEATPEDELRETFRAEAEALYRKKGPKSIGDENMEVENQEESSESSDKPKVSTSGWRSARHLNYRRAKKEKSKKKKGSFMKF